MLPILELILSIATALCARQASARLVKSQQVRMQHKRALATANDLCVRVLVEAPVSTHTHSLHTQYVIAGPRCRGGGRSLSFIFPRTTRVQKKAVQYVQHVSFEHLINLGFGNFCSIRFRVCCSCNGAISRSFFCRIILSLLYGKGSRKN